MSYSPARIDENAKPETDYQPLPAMRAENLKPVPSWFAEGSAHADGAAAAEHYRERAARHAERQRAENEQMEDYRRRLDEKFNLAKQLYDRPGNDNPQYDKRIEPRVIESAASISEPQRAPSQHLPMGSSAAEPMLHVRRPTIPIGEIEKRKKHYANGNNDTRSRHPARRSKSNVGYYAAAAAIAVIVGAGTGYGLASHVNFWAVTQDTISKARQWVEAVAIKPAPVAAPVVATASGISNFTKPIAEARIAVNDVRGTLNSMIPLVLTATPASAEQPIDLEITGLPQSAYLTAGRQKEDGSWIVKTPEMVGLKLVVPQSQTPKIDLQVAAVEQTSGSLAAPVQQMSVELSDVKITPASAQPDGQSDPQQGNTAVSAVPAPIAASQGPGSDLLARADGLMNQGDILSARQYYMQASAAGNPRGTLGVARSYDPKVFSEMKIEGLQPDPAKAAEWYKKAQAQGLTAQH